MEVTHWIIKYNKEKGEYILYAPTVSLSDIIDENNNPVETDPSAWKETAVKRGTLKDCLQLLMALDNFKGQ